MGTRDPRIDAYIEKSAPFARPILSHLREVVHAAVPEVQEDIKWGMPSFMYKGILCGLAAFKEHAAFNFWKHSLIVGGERPDDAMGSFGRITSLADLPPDEELAKYLKEAKRLNDEGVKAPKREKPPEEKKELAVPDDLIAALETNPAAMEHFEKFSPSKRKDYIEWITDAKSDATRKKRLETAVEWISEGKGRNWKYERK
ncbi:MAG TPA: YdeI/OmpD-associated family protein [Longimicrobiaceae bacterium]